MVSISSRARNALRRMGCSGPNFLRVSKRHGATQPCGFFVDCHIQPADRVIHDGDIRVVTDMGSAPFMKGLAIDIGTSGLVIS